MISVNCVFITSSLFLIIIIITAGMKMSPGRRHFGVKYIKNKAMENCKLAYIYNLLKNISICTGHEVSCPASNFLNIYYV